MTSVGTEFFILNPDNHIPKLKRRDPEDPAFGGSLTNLFELVYLFLTPNLIPARPKNPSSISIMVEGSGTGSSSDSTRVVSIRK